MAIADSSGSWINWRAIGEGPPVLCIMGLGGSSRMWWRLLPHLTALHEALLFDNRGTGDSDRISGLLSMDDLVDDAISVLDAAGIERAHVLGVSMGGMVAQRVALDHRERVISLTLGCTTAASRGGSPPWRLLVAAASRPVLGSQRSFPLIAPALFSEHTRRERPERVREDMAVRGADRTPPMTIYAQLAAVSRHDTRRRLAELAGVPTLVLHGEDDMLVSPDRGRELAGGIPGAKLVMLERCGHMLTTDAEERTAQSILDHIQSCREPALATA